MADQMVRESYQNTYQQLFELRPPGSITIGESEADIISQGRGFVGAFDLTMQLQVGCPGGCLFCYVPSGTRLTPASIRGEHGEQWGFRVRNKRDVMGRFDEHLRRGTLADKTVYWSGVTDPYAAAPAWTKHIWQSLDRAPAELRPRRIVVQTRFRPDRDAALMGEYSQSTKAADGGPAVLVSYSIGTDRNDLIRAWERATPNFEQRMKAIETLRTAGIYLVTTLSPFGFWNDLAGTLAQFEDWGVAYLTCLFFKETTESANTPTRFLGYLREKYPLLLDRRWQGEQVAVMKGVFGEKRVLLGKAGFASLVRPQFIRAMEEARQ